MKQFKVKRQFFSIHINSKIIIFIENQEISVCIDFLNTFKIMVLLMDIFSKFILINVIYLFNPIQIYKLYSTSNNLLNILFPEEALDCLISHSHVFSYFQLLAHTVPHYQVLVPKIFDNMIPHRQVVNIVVFCYYILNNFVPHYQMFGQFVSQHLDFSSVSIHHRYHVEN